MTLEPLVAVTIQNHQEIITHQRSFFENLGVGHRKPQSFLRPT